MKYVNASRSKAPVAAVEVDVAVVFEVGLNWKAIIKNTAFSDKA